MDKLKSVKIEKLAAEVGAAASNYSGADIVDMEGYEGVIFVAVFGTSAADNGLKVQQDTTSDHSDDPQDLAGSQVLLDGTEETAIIDVYRPRERYLRPIGVRGTSTTIASIVAIKYGAAKQPVDNDADTDNSAETHISPAEGTA